MSIIFKEESFFEILEEIKPFFQTHYEEVSTLKDEGIKLNPDYALYKELDVAGCLCMITAREENKIVGYTLSVKIPQLHYKNTILSYNDAIYVIPEKRHSTLGYRLIKKTEEIMITKGVDILTLHIKTNHDWSGLAKKMGYKEVEKIYHKRTT